MPPELNPTNSRGVTIPSNIGIGQSPSGFPIHAPIQQIAQHGIVRQHQQQQQQEQEHRQQEQRQVDVMRLIERYHIMWQGMLCLKNDSATVQLHFISGSRTMAEHSLPDQPTIESPSGVS